MMGYTHVTIGVALGLGIGVLSQSPFMESVGLALIAGLAALAPDIDHPQSKIRRKTGIVGRLSLFWLSHRGLTHTLLANAGIFALSYLLAQEAAQWAVVAGYSSHLVADALTQRGIPLFWPISKRSFHALPRPIRLTSGGFVENIIWFVAVVGIGYMLVRFSYDLP